MANSKLKSAGAVLAGVVAVVAITTAVDVLLHAIGFYTGKVLDDAQSAVATAYRVVIGVAGGWLVARLAPARPMAHALALGIVGTLLGLLGLVLTWNLGLGPRWYPIALVLLAVPQSWAGGRLFLRAKAATRGA